ncbi:MAG: hypothetical protein ABI475_11955 [Methylophilaceae bacterium]
MSFTAVMLVVDAEAVTFWQMHAAVSALHHIFLDYLGVFCGFRCGLDVAPVAFEDCNQ